MLAIILNFNNKQIKKILPLCVAWKVVGDDCSDPDVNLWEYNALPKFGAPGNNEYIPYLFKPVNRKVTSIIHTIQL